MAATKRRLSAREIEDRNTVDKIGDQLPFPSREAYNMIRTNLSLSLPALGRAKTIGITSALPQEGKSYTAINVAFSLAKNGSRVLLISADLRKPSVERKLSIKPEAGMSEYLCGAVKDLPILHGILHENLSLLPAGSPPPNPSELLGSAMMREMIAKLQQEYDYILLDLPPVLAVTDTIVTGAFIDGVVVVVAHATSQKKQVSQAMRMLGYADIRILGFVYNHNEETKHSSHHSYYEYYEKEDNGEENPDEALVKEAQAAGNAEKAEDAPKAEEKKD